MPWCAPASIPRAKFPMARPSGSRSIPRAALRCARKLEVMNILPSYLILDPNVDRLPPPLLRELQSERLRNMVRYCYANTPFWRQKFDAAGVSPEDILTVDDLPKLPFCTKAELQADQQAYPPFGSYVGAPRSHWARYFATSGTTGQ